MSRDPGGNARIASNGVSSPIKNPSRKKTASARSSRECDAPAANSFGIDVDSAKLFPRSK